MDNDSLVDLFKQQIKENNELQKMIVEQNKQIIELSKDRAVNITNNNTNCNNNKFNLNFFLNEQCKDALNIGDFIDSLQLKLSDLENTARLGYVEGISNIFVKGLKELDLYKRPVHCSDIKRETLYIKDEDKWLKEDEENMKLKQAIKKITNKNIDKIAEWVDENPNCKDSSSKKNDEYMNLISNCMSGTCTEDQKQNMSKIITKVAKEVCIQKMS
jgi:hypothetical protein